MPHYEFEVKISLVAPILSQLTGGRTFGLDSAIRRNDDQYPVLPGSLVRGNIRHSWDYFAQTFGAKLDDLPASEKWLGDESDRGKEIDQSNNEPKRARLSFDDYWVATEQGQTGVRYRIVIDDATGSAKDNMLQAIESPYLSGELVEFKGCVTGHCDDEKQANVLKKWLQKGLEYQPALGALKGIGFGRVKHVCVTWKRVEKAPRQIVSQQHSSRKLGLRIVPDRPFCFAKPHASNNRFESEEFIPGGALKGAIATRLFSHSGEQDAPLLTKHFDDLRITHAFAAARDSTHRPLVPPLSLVSAPVSADPNSNPALYDVALCEEGPIHGVAPAFIPDWKTEDWNLLKPLFGDVNLEHELRVRTKIEPGKNSAEQEKLFAVDAIKPDGYCWIAEISLPDMPSDDLQKINQELANLEQDGIEHLGKTKARSRSLEICATAYPRKMSCFAPLHGGLAIVTLQSAARLLPQPWGIQSTNDGKNLFARYQNSWNELSDGSLQLVRFYAQQMLVGGNYLWSRFQQRQGSYNPELLTNAGSVFVLQATDHDKAEDRLNTWLDHGLPQLCNAPGGEDWRKTPYIAPNGYGEIVVNLKLHWERKAPGGDKG